MRELLIWRCSYAPVHLGFAAARRVSRTTLSAPDGLRALTVGDRGLDRCVSGLSSRKKTWRQLSQQCGSGPCYPVIGLNQPPFVSLITRRTDDVHVHASMCCLRCAARKLHLARPGSTNLQQPGRRMENQLGSTLTITAVQPSGQLSGTYISPSGTTGSVYPLVGWFANPVAGSTALSKLPAITFRCIGVTTAA